MSTNCETAPSSKLTDNDRLAVSTAEAARLLGVGRTLIYTLLEGDLRSVKIGSRRLIAISAIHEFLEKREKPNSSPAAETPRGKQP